MKNLETLVNDINKNNDYITFNCYELGKKNSIIFMHREEDFKILFCTQDGEVQNITKKRDDIRNVFLLPSKTIGYDAHVVIELKDGTNASFRMKERFKALNLLTLLLGYGYNPDEPFKYCNPLGDKDKAINELVNVSMSFSKKLKFKIARLWILIISSAIFVGLLLTVIILMFK